MFGFTKVQTVVGLDIGASAVKAVELCRSGKTYKVAALAREPVPPGSVVDGAILDGGAVAAAIRRLFDRHAFTSKDVVTSLSGHAVIVKKIRLPVMTEDELAESMYWEAEQYIPFDIEDVNLEYQMLDADRGPDDRGEMDVLLVAAKKERIANCASVIVQAGCLPVVVDVDAFALQNACEANYSLEPGVVFVLIDAGASSITINIVRDWQPLVTRAIALGGNAYTEAIQRELNLPFDVAESAKKGEPISHVMFDDVKPVVHAMTETVLFEIEKTFDFFRASAPTEQITRIFLCGGAAAVDGFADALAHRFSVPVEMLDPFRRIELGESTSGIPQSEIASSVAVAVGLALRNAGDR